MSAFEEVSEALENLRQATLDRRGWRLVAVHGAPMQTQQALRKHDR